MLPLWPDAERLILGENMVTWYRRGKQHSISLPFNGPEQIDFDAFAAALPNSFQKLHGRKLKVILSNHWVRYLVVPWQEHVFAQKDWLALAQNRFREQFGAKAAGWDVEISLQGYGRPVLAVATNRQMSEGLDYLADLYRWQLQATEPAFASLVNNFPRHWRGDKWLLMADNNHLLLAESKAGIWERFSSMMSSAEMMEENAMMLVQQARQFNPEIRKRSLYLFRNADLPSDNFIHDMDIRLLTADWLKQEKAETLR